MTGLPKLPPLKPLHPESSLNPGKLKEMKKVSTEHLLATLSEGEHHLKTRPDGTILEGHHRVYVLRGRGVDVDRLPREIIEKE